MSFKAHWYSWLKIKQIRQQKLFEFKIVIFKVPYTGLKFLIYSYIQTLYLGFLNKFVNFIPLNKENLRCDFNTKQIFT